MIKQKILSSLFFAILLVISSPSLSNGAVESVGDPGKFWSIPNDAERGMHVMGFYEKAPSEPPSFLVPNINIDKYSDSDPTCLNLEDPKCLNRSINYQAVIPVCKELLDLNCIEDLGIVDSNNVKSSAIFKRYFPNRAQNQFEGNPQNNLPSGGPGSIFSIPGATHFGGDNYHISVVMSGAGQGRSISLYDFSIELSPVKLETINGLCGFTNCNDSGWGIVKPEPFGGNPTGKDAWIRQAPGLTGENYCVASSSKEGLCAQRYAFPANLKFYVKVRLTQSPVGWMHGRISDPDIQVSSLAGNTVIEVQAFPVAVPAVYKMYRYADMPAQLKAEYDITTGGYKKDPNFIRSEGGYAQGGRTAHSPDPLQRNVMYNPAPSAPEGMEQLKLWLPYVGDKAAALLSYWSVRTLSSNEMSSAGPCFKDTAKITGIVTTNATQYSAGPPAFDKEEGTLNYVVGAPHFGTTGSEFKGSYDLVIRSDVARCIYGFSKAPIKAILSVTSSDGTPQVATTIIGERNDWVYLQARNFEFSAPTIKAKLTQDIPIDVKPVAEPTPTPTETVTQSAAAMPKIKSPIKKLVITCVKGTSSKKISGSEPKCPSGYKKKK